MDEEEFIESVKKYGKLPSKKFWQKIYELDKELKDQNTGIVLLFCKYILKHPGQYRKKYKYFKLRITIIRLHLTDTFLKQATF
jgi:hypothetical protein